MQIPLTEPQEQFVFSENPFPAIVGGLGSGKSKGGTMRIVKQLLSDPGADVAYYMPTYDLIRLRAIPGIEQDLEQIGVEYKTCRNLYTITVYGYGDIIFRSYDNPNRIIAYEVADSICDELDTLPKDKAEVVWRKITERNRQERGRTNTIGLVTTPDQGINGFVYDKWIKKKQAGYELIKAPTYSNPFVPADYIEQIRANYDPILADLYINGEFVSLSQNKVYHFFDRFKHHTTRVLTEEDKQLHISIDFNVGGCCSIVFIIENNQPFAVDEFSSHDTQDFINRLARFKDRRVIVYPDASGKARKTNASESDISLITNAGFQTMHNNSNPAVRDRINAFNAMLSHNKFWINTDKCPELTHALESQGYDDKGEPEKFDTHPAIDDWVDSAGYFMAYRFPIVRPMSHIRLAGI